MKDQWILVANASLARIFKRRSGSEALSPVETMTHEQSRLKGAELAQDRPGREASDNSLGANRFEPRSDVRRKEHQRFAREIAARLDAGLAAGEFGSLVISASNPFLGELRAQLSEGVARHITEALDSDFTSFGASEVDARLRSHGSAAK